jgi:predicted nucleic acid-binding Zn ribbon protein
MMHMKYQCPTCQRVLYSRRLKHCGFCGAPIPDGLRFTPEETAAIDQQMSELEKQHKQRERDIEEEEAARRKAIRPHL